MARGPAVFTVPPGEDFAGALARQLLIETSADPLALAAMLVLLPTRRSARALREAFLRESGGRTLLLPRMQPLGDADEDDPALADAPDADLPPAIAPLRRLVLLAKAILGLGHAAGGVGAATPEQAVPLAVELARLLDQVQTEEIGFDKLANLAPADFAKHWQTTLKFLEILTARWPRIVKAEGAIDPAERRAKLIRAQAAAWAESPPDFPVIAAGSTGSIPATRELLATVARLPNGRLVLPGLDRDLDRESRDALEASHPQHGLLMLLAALGVEPHTVPLWPGAAATQEAAARARLVSEAMRPAATTDAWRRLAAEEMRPALAHVSRIDAPGPREEAAAIALRLRAALETEGRTAALVTHDRDLARRVAAELRRYDIEVDDSAGQPLALTEPGAFLLLTAEMAAEGFAPLPLLAALKHPLAAGGLTPGEFRRRVRLLERKALRGPRPAPGLAALRRAIAGERTLAEWLDKLDAMGAAFAAALARPTPLGDLLKLHAAFAERLAADESQPGAARLWAGEAGEAASSFLNELAEADERDGLPPILGAAYPGLLRALMADRAVRPAWGRHPRMSIWGPLEARLQRADLLILGGLNEGSWPPEALADPWMSRPMRAEFGLPAPERRVGLAAHDFAQAFCAPEVVLTRAARVQGTPTVPSRWLLRLDAALAACGLVELPRDGRWLDWSAALDRPVEAPANRPQPPAPRPPLAARPRRLYVTDIELWRRDPYALYARRILRLEALDPIDAEPGAADYGSIVHDALAAFLRADPRGPLPPDARALMLAAGRAAFGGQLDRPGIWAFWWPRFERIADWVLAREAERRPGIEASWAEVTGERQIGAPGGPFLLRARADRIDRLADGRLAVIDYKTGTVPRGAEIEAGYAPQLPLEGAIAAAGGFADIPAGAIESLRFWKLSGGREAGEDIPAATKSKSADELARDALAGLQRLVAAFDDPATPYEARPHPQFAPRFSNYDHLARALEWSADAQAE